jgi:hypothetical protein
MDRGMCFAGFELEFARVSKPKEAVSCRREKKYVHPPIGGCAPTLSLPLFRRDRAEQQVAPYFDTRNGLPEIPGRRHGMVLRCW